MPSIEIHDLRLSIVCVETVPDLADGKVPGDAPLAFLAAADSYAQRFDQLLGGAAGDLLPPWERPAGQFFWTYYLENKVPGQIGGATAWKQLVPFRGRLTTVPTAPWLAGRLNLEAFYYPHAIALVLTAVSRASLGLEAAVQKAFEVRRDGTYQVAWGPQEPPKPVKLDALLRTALDAVRDKVLGAGFSGSRSQPFSVATVVQAEGVDPAAATEDGGEVHRALEALTTWRPSWQQDALPPLAEASLQIRTAPPSHVLYGRRRGRAVWFPGLFGQQAGNLRSLSCYHRNLVFAALQVESLIGLVRETEERRSRGIVPVGTRRDIARRAAGILGRLYGGVDKTYRSWSPRAHLDDNGWVAEVNSLRDYFDMPALS